MTLAEFDAKMEAQAAAEMRRKGWLPYGERGPQTTDLRVLRDYLHEVRARCGRGPSEGAEAYNRLAKAASQQGMPLDGLRRHSKIESERFFSRTVPGPEGHVYWNTPKGREDAFRTNDGRSRTPARWWWEHVHGPIGSGTLRVYPICGDRNCINVEHNECRPFQGRRHSDEQLLGFIQVAAMRLGRAPTERQFDKMGFGITSGAVKLRFGTWKQAVAKAGFTPYATTRLCDADTCKASLRFAVNFLGRAPLTDDYRTNEPLRKALQAEGLPFSTNAIRRYLGSWRNAIRMAEKP